MTKNFPIANDIATIPVVTSVSMSELYGTVKPFNADRNEEEGRQRGGITKCGRKYFRFHRVDRARAYLDNIQTLFRLLCALHFARAPQKTLCRVH